MRRGILLAIFLVALAPFVALAQYSNSWINFSQPYFKVPVAAEGIYRLTYSQLQAAGFPVNAVDPRFIQVFHRGAEQSVYIKGQSDGIFNASDYLEFYGKKNDGTLDSALYQPSSFQPHKYYNLYSDTTAYFLTVSASSTRGLRMDSVQLVNVGNLPAETYQYSQRLYIYHDGFSPGVTGNDVTQATAFDQGEGWMGPPIQQGQTVDFFVDSVFNTVTTASNPRLEMLLVGRDVVPHAFQIWVGANAASLRLLVSPNFNNFETYLINTDILWSDVGADGKILVRVIALPASTERYQASVAYLKLTFAQNFDFSSIRKKNFQLPVNAGDQSYVVISNPLSNFKLYDVTDAQHITRISPPSASATFNVIVPGTSVVRTLWASSQYATPSVIPLSFRQLNRTANYLIITHRALTKPAGGYSNVVQAFAAYRASAAGGGYDTLTVAIDQLYNQFNYGEVSPLGIFNFLKFIVPGGHLKYLFLVGKGRDISYSPYQRNALLPDELPDLVPSAGYPGGDNAYTAGLNGSTYEPAVPTGRLTATTPAQVAAYLNKVKELESKSLQPWAKELLHLSGGGSATTDAFELAEFRQIVDGFKQIAIGPYLGGHVTTLAKQNVGVEKFNVSSVINQGVNLVTFFGHSSSSTIDIDIGFVDDPTLGYNNGGKYPVFIINGCNAGTIFSNEVTFGEDWILAAGKGSRNFIGGTSFGFSNLLQEYTNLMYQVGFGDSTFIQRGIGDIQKEACRRFINTSSVNIYTIAQVQQMVLAGDPAVKLFGTAMPDYSIGNGSLSLTSLDGKSVTSLSDSFAVSIIVKNLGAYHPTPMKIRVVRTLNDNTTQTYDSIFSPVLYADTLLFKIQNSGINGFGNNQFAVTIDPLNVIKEISKANNTATLNAFIPSNGTLNLYPPDFGIVNQASFNLVFQDADLLGTQRSFTIQIDTTNTFNSPFAIKKTVTAQVLAKLAVTLQSIDSLVYYWRTKPVKVNAGDSANWTSSSFTYINGSPEGWAQKKFPQVNEDVLVNLSAAVPPKKINYLQAVSQVSVKSIGVNSPSDFTAASIKVDGVEYNTPVQVPCRTNTINLVAFNKATAAPYPGISFYFNDQRGCGLQPAVINSFTSSEVETGNGDDLLQYVDNIQPSDSVVLFSVGDPSFSQWSSNVLSQLDALGISNAQITSLQDGEPVIIFAKKGAAPGSAKVYRSSTAPVTSQDVAVASTMTGRFSSGSIQSPLIGPASKWGMFTASVKDVEAGDNVSYSIYGVTLSGQETLIQANITSALDLSFINPVQFPQLKVELNMQDNINQTAVQLREWFVLYESVADGLLFYQGPAAAQSVTEGQPFVGQYGFTNISSKAFTDSLLVRTEVITVAKASNETNTFRIKAPAPGDTTRFLFTINTYNKEGFNNVNVFVNPKILPEQYYENNVINLAKYLDVIADHAPPLVDVTVDGRYLVNGDFISPNPEILIKLHDDNPFLFIADTTHLNIALSYPCANQPCPYKGINFSRGDVQWTPASAHEDFTVHFNPLNLPEGSYVLEVNGSDESGNASTTPYQINFRVADETTLALRSVYPNPSSDFFIFSFVLSGNVLPDNFSLDIFSMNGELVHRFDAGVAAGFVVGTNTLTWRAADGNADGLYIYRLSVSVNGKTASQSGKLALAK